MSELLARATGSACRARTAFPRGRPAITLAAYYDAQQGRPYSYLDGSDSNRDGTRGNDLLYVPRDAADVIVTNGTFDDLMRFLSAGCDVTPGTIVPRNACRGPWVHTLDFRLGVDFPRGTERGRALPRRPEPDQRVRREERPRGVRLLPEPPARPVERRPGQRPLHPQPQLAGPARVHGRPLRARRPAEPVAGAAAGALLVRTNRAGLRWRGPRSHRQCTLDASATRTARTNARPVAPAHRQPHPFLPGRLPALRSARFTGPCRASRPARIARRSKSRFGPGRGRPDTNHARSTGRLAMNLTC